MKITDFGLWFRNWSNYEWSNTIPQRPGCDIYYDGQNLGYQTSYFDVRIYARKDQPHMIKLKSDFTRTVIHYEINRLITMEDFEIISNPYYKDCHETY